LNSKQRVLATINFKKPDMVPIALYEILIGAKMIKKPFGKIFLNGKLLAQSRLRVYEEFGQDIIDVETGIATEAESCGCLVEYPDNEAPWIKKPVLEDLSDVSKLKVTDSYSSRSMYANLEAVNIISQKIGQEIFIIGEADQGPFSLCGALRGMENFYMDLAFSENEGKIHKLLEYTSEVFLNYARALSEAGADMICMGESPAGPSLISPKQYNLFAKPYEEKIIKILNKEGILVANHICGCVDKILDDFIDTGADIIEIDEKTNLNLAKNKTKKITTMMGAVAPNILTFGSQKEIEIEVKRNLEICMPDYGYILSPGCVIGTNTPIKNIKSFMDFGRKYGKY